MNKFKQIILSIISLSSNSSNKVVLKYRHVKVGDNLNINGRIHVVSNTSDGITIGNNVRINSSRGSNPIEGDTITTLFAKGNGKIFIGDNFGISKSTIFACESITKGNNVLLSGSVKIYDTDFHWLDYDKRMSRVVGAQPSLFI